MSEKVLFLLLDAFRGDYINPIDTPFLHEKSQQGVFCRKMRSIAGFSQRTTVVTGVKGDVSGNFTMFRFDREHSPFRFLRNHAPIANVRRREKWIHAIPRFKGSGRLKKFLFRRLVDAPRAELKTWIASEVKKYAPHAPLGHIPLELLPEVAVAEDEKPIHLPNAFDVESIFDVLVAAGVPYDYLMYPVTELEDEAVLQAVLKARTKPAKLILAQFSDSDYFVHHCGPSSPERRPIMAEIDRKLREIWKAYGEDCTWIVIGDHGMADVTEEIDVDRIAAAEAARIGASKGVDYLIFLDSTMARFHWQTPKGAALEAALRAHPSLARLGRFIDEELAREYAIPLHDKRYGDLIWWANVGVLIFPDYFHDANTHNKGMHGYESSHDAMKGFFLAFGPGIVPRVLDGAQLTDVCPSLCKALGVRAPRESTGTALI
jgi:predicted AlkP superfamily pyrophosphatase or phosphodiesterase